MHALCVPYNCLPHTLLSWAHRRARRFRALHCCILVSGTGSAAAAPVYSACSKRLVVDNYVVRDCSQRPSGSASCVVTAHHMKCDGTHTSRWNEGQPSHCPQAQNTRHPNRRLHFFALLRSWNQPSSQDRGSWVLASRSALRRRHAYASGRRSGHDAAFTWTGAEVSCACVDIVLSCTADGAPRGDRVPLTSPCRSCPCPARRWRRTFPAVACHFTRRSARAGREKWSRSWLSRGAAI